MFFGMAAARRNLALLGSLTALAILVGASPALAVTVGAVQDPRPDGWVVDQTGTLNAGLRDQIEEVARRVHDRGGELVAVLVEDLSGADPRTFATALGNRWNLNSRGALLLVATEVRAAEIVLGHRVDGDAQVRISREIMSRRMVPQFREGDYGAGLLAGVQAVEQRILATEAPADSLSVVTPLPGSRTQSRPAPRRHVRDDPLVLALSGILAIGGMILGFFWLRRLPRCKQCLVSRVRLGEMEEDAHLSAPERWEEKLGSVNYDLWACPRCGDILKRRYRRFINYLRRCPECGFETLSRVRKVLEAATTRSAGKAEVEETCAHCDYRAVSVHTIPRKRDDSDDFSWNPSRSSSRSSSSRSSSIWSSSSSSSSSRSSSSRSSSSRGGGFSSGKGSSGRW